MKSNQKFYLPIIFIAVSAVLTVFSCASQKKVKQLQEQQMKADINIADDYAYRPDGELDIDAMAKKDSVVSFEFFGKQVTVMDAVKDENGEMVAHDVINAAVVTARFRNIAERHGKIDLKFDVTVPKEMLDSKWQLRFYPQMTLLGETSDLDPIYVTGKDYRKDQLRGYQLYQKYIDSIITDTTVFINRHLLETFIERNIPSLAKYKNSMETVDPKTFESDLGVTGQQAIDHYTNWMRVRYNRRKIRNKDKMFHKYVKAPIRTEGLRLDTIITNPDGGMTYAYVQTINTRPKLKRADVTLAGEIFEGPEKVYSIPQTDPITFYISSLSSFTDGRNKYRSMIVYRQVEANSACWVDFEQGRSEVKLDLSNNATEIARIKKNLRGLLDNETFEMDSINVLASCSPEGSIITNAKLAQARAESVTGYFKDYMRHVADSMRREAGFAVSVDDSYKTSEMSSAYKAADITFQSTSRAENWDPLDKLVEKDETLTDADKQDYKEMRSSIGDVDALERQMQGRPWYKYVRETLYPRLRTVEFTFHMHRRGMVKDTVHTTVLDTAYMAGVEALKDRDYELAITKLRPYSPDYNLAVAYCAMDYNVSAQDILEQLPETAEVDYMLALVYARKGNSTAAVKRYMSSIQKNPSYKFRGNLDPEISELIKRYRLDKVGAEDDIPVDF